MRKFIPILLVILCVTYTHAQELVRGPYQQKGTTHSMNIMWRTSEPVDGWVKVGDTPGNLDRIFTGDTTKNHDIEVTGLQPYTKYYYAIGYGDITLASGIDHYITTNKSYGDTSGVSFWAIGDFGKANVPKQMARDAFSRYSKTHPVDFMVMLGDNAYQNGEDSEYQEKVFGKEFGYDSIFRYLHYYPTPGNHDYNIIRGDNLLNWLNPTLDTGPYFDSHDLPTNGEAGGYPSGTELYYSYDVGHVHFISLNSELYVWTDNHASPMKTWLQKDLAHNKLPWVVVYFHQPPYTMGSHSSDDGYEFMMKNIRQNIIPILENAQVDLVLCGHSHVYERSYLIHGHYGKIFTFDPHTNIIDGSSGNPDIGETYHKDSLNRGTLYIVEGNSGNYTSDDKIPAIMHPVFYFRDGGTDVTGSLIVDIKGGTLTGTYINRFGDVLDKFALQKEIGEIEIPTKIKENFSDVYQMKAFPNPSSDVLSLEFKNPTTEKARITISDVSGREILTQESTLTGISTAQINGWKQLPAGSYILSLYIGDKMGSLEVSKLK